MNWVDVLGNQCFSFTTLQNAVTNGFFGLKNSITSSSEMVTVAEAEYHVYINAIGGSSSRLPVKSNLVTNVGQPFDISCNGAAVSGGACALSTGCTAYLMGSTPTFGAVIYADLYLTTIYNFTAYTGPHIKIQSDTNVPSVYSRARVDTTSSTINTTPVSC
jgi:hypothetical protein